MQILWASPLPPIRSGVSDYAVELLAELAELASLRVVMPPEWRPPDPPLFGKGVELVPPETRPLDAEVQLVHIGNNPHHAWLIGRLAMARSVAVLHDLVLHHLLVEATLGRDDTDGFRRRLGRAHPEAAQALAAARSVGISGRRDPFLFAARRALLADCRWIVVHSDWGRAQVERDLPDARVARVGLAVADPGPIDRAALRSHLDIAAGEVVLMHLGFLTPEKGMLELLAALGAAARAGVDARLLIVGEGGEREALSSAAAAVGLAERVSFTGYISAEEFPSLPAAADLGVVLRTPSAGETSAAAVRFLACATPVAVTGLHQFLEWPEAAAPRVTPGPPAAAELARHLMTAAAGNGWADRRRAARAAYEADHRPVASARRLVSLLSGWFPDLA